MVLDGHPAASSSTPSSEPRTATTSSSASTRPTARRGVGRLRVGLPFAEAWFTNLLEDRLGPAEVDGDEVVIPFRPFEIVTVALR